MMTFTKEMLSSSENIHAILKGEASWNSKAYKIEYRRIGSGWRIMECILEDHWKEFMENNKVAEYIIREEKIVEILFIDGKETFETAELLFSGHKYVYVQGKALMDDRYDYDNTPAEKDACPNKQEAKEDVKNEKRTIGKNKLKKTSFFVQFYNGDKEYHDNGYEIKLPTNHMIVVHKNNKGNWNATLKENGVSLLNGYRTRQEVIEASYQLSNDMGKDELNKRIETFKEVK